MSIMPQLKTSPTPAPASRPSKRTLLIPIIITAIAVAGIGTYLYRQHQSNKAYQADKAQFTQVEADMKATYQAMTTAAGKPDVSKYDKGCGRPNLKFKNGSLFCNVTYTFAYGENDLDGAYKHTKALQDSIVQNGHIITSQNTANDILDNQSQALRFTIESPIGMSCELIFSYDLSRDDAKSEAFTNRFTSNYQYRCTKGVKIAIY